MCTLSGQSLDLRGKPQEFPPDASTANAHRRLVLPLAERSTPRPPHPLFRRLCRVTKREIILYPEGDRFSRVTGMPTRGRRPIEVGIVERDSLEKLPDGHQTRAQHDNNEV